MRLPDLPDVFRGRDAVAAGALTPSQLRGPRVQRVVHGVYAPAEVEVTHELRCRAVGLVAPAAAGLTGRSRATVLGVLLAEAHEPVEVAVPEAGRFGPLRGVRVRRARSRPFGCSPWREFRLVDHGRWCLDLCADVPLPRAVAHLDAVARAGH